MSAAAVQAEMTMDELSFLETEEYQDLVDRLSKQPDFIAFIARWVSDAGSVPVTAIRADNLDQVNWQMGRVSLLSEFMESLRMVHNAAYLNIMEEVNRYGIRRQRADERADEYGGHGPELGSELDDG